MDPIPTWWIVVVAVRSGDRYLLVRERKFGQRWYLPAGRVDPGEDPMAAAERETLEETGLRVIPDGLLAVEYLPAPPGEAARLRIWLSARPLDPAAVPKQRPDDESLEARWLRLAEIPPDALRAPEALHWLERLQRGDQPAPLSLLRREDAPYADGTRAAAPRDPADHQAHSAAGPQISRSPA